jgi:hypothetical protein
MDVLTTRVLSYPDKNGDEKELALTVFMPFKAAEWRCCFIFDPPLIRRVVYGAGIDFIQAFVESLKVARIWFENTAPFDRAHWQGVPGCGLPSRGEKPASLGPADIPPPDGTAGNMDVLTTRMLGYPNESGAETELLLTVFMPFKVEGEIWKCGFTFGPPTIAPIRYGVGADLIEALLDGLAMARATFEGTVPKGWRASGDILDCADLPYKIGRSFWTDLTGEPPPDMPDFFGDAELSPNKP